MNSNLNKLGKISANDSNIEALTQIRQLVKGVEIVANERIIGPPLLRTVHHLACSGGTLISKCISSLANVVLYSEAHPYTDIHLNLDNPMFLPTDISSLARYSRVGNDKEYLGQHFRNSIEHACNYFNDRGARLVIRDHSHSDFCVEGKFHEFEKTLINLLSQTMDIKSVVTYRNPIDSYISLRKNGWIHFNPKSFEEYCRRVLLFIKAYSDVQYVLYEDFVSNPSSKMQLICEILDLPFCSNFETIFPSIALSGDSGRNSGVITSRARPDLSKDMLSEIADSESFFEIGKIISPYSL